MRSCRLPLISIICGSQRRSLYKAWEIQENATGHPILNLCVHICFRLSARRTGKDQLVVKLFIAVYSQNSIDLICFNNFYIGY